MSATRFYLPDLSVATQPYESVALDARDFSDKPTHLRIVWEETGDECGWHLDGVDATGHYTEAVERYATLNEALAARAHFVSENFA